jgi:hypothetical protein
MLKENDPCVVPYKASQYVVSRFRRLAGKTLIVIDAAIQDPKQNKAIKDLLKKSFSEEIADTREFFGDKMGESHGTLEQLAEPI